MKKRKMYINATDKDNIFSDRKESDDVTIKKEKKNLILKMILSKEYKLSASKFKVYKLFCGGMSYREISEKLKISMQVAKNYKYESERKINKIIMELNKI